MLGGGPAGLATAFELSATRALRERYEVTVYQRGWRVGGKCASGREGPHRRVQEHGLHLWFGFYENAFGMARRAYDALGDDADAALEREFIPVDDIVLYERQGRNWIGHQVTMPRNEASPAQGADTGEAQFWKLADATLTWLNKRWRELTGDPSGRTARDGLANAQVIAHAHAEGGSPDGERRVGGALRSLVQELDSFMREEASPAPAPGGRGDALRFVLTILDMTVATVRGILEDGLLAGDGWARVNEKDFRDWLEGHGADRDLLDASPVARGLYDLVFAYEDGDVKRGNLAAGKALQALIRIGLTYRGSIIYKMRCGMGESVVLPLYDALVERGVRFEFFKSVTRLAVDPAGQAVECIDIAPQVRLTGAAYDPIEAPADGGQLRYWPAEPRWSQIDPDDRRALGDADLEREENPLRRPIEALERGRDFDVAVLAFPIAALPHVGRELADHSAAFRDMLVHSHTVATQALQLWTERTLDGAVGWEHATEAVMTSFAEPLDTYCNMTHVLDCEGWSGARRPRGLAYVCGPLRDAPTDSQAKAEARVDRNVARYLKSQLPRLWPVVSLGEGDEPPIVVDRYRRANWTGSERYVMTRAGTVGHRLRADESGYSNLILAGDWTRNGICGGAVEAAVTSGMQAARAISGEPAEIPGLDGWLERD